VVWCVLDMQSHTITPLVGEAAVELALLVVVCWVGRDGRIAVTADGHTQLPHTHTHTRTPQHPTAPVQQQGDVEPVDIDRLDARLRRRHRPGYEEGAGEGPVGGGGKRLQQEDNH